MSRRATPFTLTIALPAEGGGARWLATALRDEILAGRLRAATRLPATRELAEQLSVARGTVVEAFERLKSEGYLKGASGSGTFVNDVLPDDLFTVPGGARRGRDAAKPLAIELSAYGRRLSLYGALENRPTRAFRPNVPALDRFPIALWAKLAAQRARAMTTSALLSCDAMGYLPLREAIASYLGAARGVSCEPAQIAIVAGTQEAIDLITRLLLDPGDIVAMESPGYEGSRGAFTAAGAKIADVPVDGEGMCVVPKLMRDARLAYVTPGHQFPLGMTMSLKRRFEMLAWLRASGALLFEDDYDSEFRYSGRPIPSLQGLDRTGRVIYAGTFTKTIFPALRLGYLVLPPNLVDPFEAARSLTTRHPALFDQMVVCDFITGGHFGRHLRAMRETYAERLDVLLENTRSRLAGALEVSPIEAGLQTIGTIVADFHAPALARAAAARNVEIVPIKTDASAQTILMGFAAIEPTEIRRGIREIAKILDGAPRPETIARRSRTA